MWSHPSRTQVVDRNKLLGLLGQVALELVVESVQLLLPLLFLQLFNDLVQRLDLLQVLLSSYQNELFLCASDRHIQTLEVFQQHTFVCRLLGARYNYDVAVDTLTLVNGEDLFDPVLAQMRLQEQLLVKEGRNDGDPGGFDSAVFEVVNYHCADGSLDEVFVFESLSLFQFEAENDFVGLEEGDGALFYFFEPREHRVDLLREFHFLLLHCLAAVLHHSVVDYCVRQLQNVLTHSVLFLEHTR